MTASNPPDVTALLESFPPRARKYVDRRPIRAKAEGSYAIESPPHSEVPLPSDSPPFLPQQDGRELSEANVPPPIIPGPPAMANEPRALDPSKFTEYLSFN